MHWGEMSKGKRQLNPVSAQTARAQFGQILDRAQGGRERFVVGKRGQPVAVILCFDHYLESIASPSELLNEFQDQAKANGTDQMTMDEIDAEIEAARGELRLRREKTPACD